MSKIIATDRDGAVHEIPAAVGLTLMEILRDADLPVEATCGGQCICSTCHVYVDEKWRDKLNAPGELEKVLCEDSGHYESGSRLSCQIEFADELDGISLTLAPEF